MRARKTRKNPLPIVRPLEVGELELPSRLAPLASALDSLLIRWPMFHDPSAVAGAGEAQPPAPPRSTRGSRSSQQARLASRPQAAPSRTRSQGAKTPQLAPKAAPFPSFLSLHPSETASSRQTSKRSGLTFNKTNQQATHRRPLGRFRLPAMSHFGAPALQISSVSPISPVAASSASSAGGPALPPPSARGGGAGSAPGASAGTPSLLSAQQQQSLLAQHKRVYQACIPCRRRKVRCDLGSVDDPHDPPCVRCRRESKECYFSATRRKRKVDDESFDDQEQDDYILRNGRKQLRGASPPPVVIDRRLYSDVPLTPGGSHGRSQPLRRPGDTSKSVHSTSTTGEFGNGEPNTPLENLEARTVMRREVYGPHDALDLLYKAATDK